MKILLRIVLMAQILVNPLLASKVLFVQNFENNTNDEKYQATGSALADMVITDLVNLKVDDLQVVERSRIKELMGELKLQQSEYFDPASIQKMGKGLGANLTIAGSFVVVDGEMRIDARLIDVTTSEIMLTFKAKGQESEFFELGEDLIRNIGKGLSIDTKNIKRDTLSGPSTLDILVKYGDAVDLMDKGDYKSASESLANIRKEDPKFKLSESAYKEAMKKLYAAKDKRETILSESESKLLEIALKNSKSKDPKVGLTYQWVLMEMYFRQMKKIVGVDPNLFGGTESIGQGWVRELAKLKLRGKPPGIPENDMAKFNDNMNLYIQAYLAVITHASKLDQMALMGINSVFSPTDKKLIEDLGWKPPGIISSVAVMNDDLATFLLLETDFTPAPYKIDEKFDSLGFELLEKATQEAAKPSNPHKIRDTSRQIEHHGDILLEHGRDIDAIAKWQEILDKYPTYDDFKKIEEKLKKALE